MILAAIDIGSNAVRLLFSSVSEEGGEVYANKIALIRTPVRLGTDSFLRGEISLHRKEDLVKTMQAYKLLIEVYGAEDFAACATSAFREAENADEIAQEVKEKTGIEIQIIDGELEAELIYSTHIAEKLEQDKAYLYIDVGGGSTELTVFSDGKRRVAESFRIGTIRLMEKLVEDSEWKRLEDWIRKHVSEYEGPVAIGTGGNINKLFKFSGRKEGKPLFLKSLTYYEKYLSSYSYTERINILGMRPDRADVILPAIRIYKTVMKLAGIHDIIVPKVGLADGMVRMMYEKRVGKKARFKKGAKRRVPKEKQE